MPRHEQPKIAAQVEQIRYHVAAATTSEFAAEALRFTILIFVVSGESRHGRLHVVSALRNKRAELAGCDCQIPAQGMMMLGMASREPVRVRW
jgi:hypothetical protein